MRARPSIVRARTAAPPARPPRTSVRTRVLRPPCGTIAAARESVPSPERQILRPGDRRRAAGQSRRPSRSAPRGTVDSARTPMPREHRTIDRRRSTDAGIRSAVGLAATASEGAVRDRAFVAHLRQPEIAEVLPDVLVNVLVEINAVGLGSGECRQRETQGRRAENREQRQVALARGAPRRGAAAANVAMKAQTIASTFQNCSDFSVSRRPADGRDASQNHKPAIAVSHASPRSSHGAARRPAGGVNARAS